MKLRVSYSSVNELNASSPKIECRHNGFDVECSQKNRVRGTKWDFYGCENYVLPFWDSMIAYRIDRCVCVWLIWLNVQRMRMVRHCSLVVSIFFTIFDDIRTRIRRIGECWSMVGILTSTSLSQCLTALCVSFVYSTHIYRTHAF